MNVGDRFGRLVVVDGSTDRQGYVVCQCDCGNITEIRKTSLTKKKQPTRSCGCMQKEAASKTGKGNIVKNSKKQVETNLLFRTNFQVIESDVLPKNNTSGHKGLYWCNGRSMWEAYITVHGNRIHLGRFVKYTDAVKAREQAEDEYFAPIIAEKNKFVCNCRGCMAVRESNYTELKCEKYGEH